MLPKQVKWPQKPLSDPNSGTSYDSRAKASQPNRNDNL